LVTKVKPNINSVDVHPQLSNNGHPVDGALVGACSLWPLLWTITSVATSFENPWDHPCVFFYEVADAAKVAIIYGKI